MDYNFSFKEMTVEDLPMMYHWFNLPHVEEFYSFGFWSESQVQSKITPHLTGVTGDKKIHAYIISMDNKPFGFIQYYKISDYPWSQQNLTSDIVDESIGIDLFIGEIGETRKGLGTNILNYFFKNIIDSQFKYCLVDPHVKNINSIGFYRKYGFKDHKIIHTDDGLGHTQELQLMILDINKHLEQLNNLEKK